MVCTSLGSLLRPLFYFLCYIHFSLSVVQGWKTDANGFRLQFIFYVSPIRVDGTSQVNSFCNQVVNPSVIISKTCLKSPCTASTALLALIEVQGLLRQILQLYKHAYVLHTSVQTVWVAQLTTTKNVKFHKWS